MEYVTWEFERGIGYIASTYFYNRIAFIKIKRQVLYNIFFANVFGLAEVEKEEERTDKNETPFMVFFGNTSHIN